jgi:hypothetical protein
LRYGGASYSALDASGVSARLRVSIVAARPAPHAVSLFQQSVWQLEPLRFVRAGIEHLQRAGPDALDLRRIVHAQSRALVQGAGVAEHVLPAGFVDVEPDHLLADGALRHNRMKPPPSEKLDEFHSPYGQEPHVSLLANSSDYTTPSPRKAAFFRLPAEKSVQYARSRPERRLSLREAARIEPAMANTAAARW